MKFTTKIENGLIRLPNDFVAEDCLYTVEVRKKSEKRSTDANAYMWKLLTDIAVAMGSSKDEIYRLMLIRYGVKVKYDVIPKSELDSRIKEYKGAVEYKGDVTILDGDKEVPAVKVLCYPGTSTYDSREFSVFLSRIAEEAEEMEI